MVARLVSGAAPRPSRLLTLMAAAALGCATPLRAQAPATRLPTAEDSVWAAVLEADSAPAGQRLVVAVRTSSGGAGPTGGSAAERRPHGIQAGTVDDFEERNRGAREIGPLPAMRVPVTLVSEATLDSLPSAMAGDVDGYWRAFYRRFPGAAGLVTFSRVGFNAARTQAVVSVNRGCGGLCGTGTVVLLERGPDGRWRVVRNALLWIS